MKPSLEPVSAILPVAASLARRVVCSLGFSLLTVGLLAQVRPGAGGAGGGVVVAPGGGGVAGGGIAVQPGGGAAGGGIAVLPGGGGGGIAVLPGGGGGGVSTEPAINAPNGALAETTITATATLGQTGATQVSTSGATFQWSISGGRLLSDSRGVSVQFTADKPGTVTLGVSISAAGTSYSPTATVSIISAESAGTITTTATVPANATSVTASVPAAQNADRTFRWAVSAGATIVSGQGTASITYRPGTAGLKQITCNVNLQNLVTVPVRAYVVALGTGAPVMLTVNNGTGGGSIPSDSRVDVAANPPPAGKVFDRWTGDTDVLGNGAIAPSLAHATITMPARAVTLTATYKDAPVWKPTTLANFNPQTQNGPNNTTATVSTTLAYYVPANATGLVFLLHDTGSNANEWFERPNQLLLARELVAAGFGVAALNSINRTAGNWAAPAVLANNLDALNHAAAIDRLVALGALAASKPVFLLGNGAGANAAVRYADLLAASRPVKGAVLYLSAGIDTLAVTSRVPQFFAVAANDGVLGVTGLQDARDANQMLLGRGVATAFINKTVAPLHPEQFRNLAVTTPAFTDADAQAVWTAVKKAGILDDNNYPKTIPKTATLTAALPAAYQARVTDIAAEIDVAGAERALFPDANSRVLNFLNSRVADAPVPPPGRLVNLSTRSEVAFLGDSLSLGFNISGTERASLLIRGIGPGLRRFGLNGALAAAKLTLNKGSTAIATNDGWDKPGGTSSGPQLAAAAAAVGAFALTPGSLDSVVLVQLDPGSYTVNITGVGGAVGDVLAEIYDVSRNGTRLTNLSTLARINNEGDLLIPGIVIAGNNPRTLVIRAVAQGLRPFGFSTADLLGDVRISVLQGTQTVASNNNWSQGGAAALTAAFPAVGAFPLTSNSDAALLDALVPGSYTLQAGATPLTAAQIQAGAATTNQVGAVLVEVYEVP